MSAGKCKRVAPEGPLLATSSSSSDDDSPRQPPINSPSSTSSALSPASTSLQGTDHASETSSLSPIGQCSSPGGSSTSSGLSHLGHTSHRSDIRRPRSKKKRNEDFDRTPRLSFSNPRDVFDLQTSFPNQETVDLNKTYTLVKPKNFEREKEEYDSGKGETDASIEESDVYSTKEYGILSSIDGKSFPLYGKGISRNRNLGRKLSCSGNPGVTGFGEKISSGGAAGDGKGKVGDSKVSAGGQKIKPARAPMPMRQRALPPSFWQQPNVPQNVAPGTMYSVLPPLFNQETTSFTEVRPVTPPDEQDDDTVETFRTTIQGSEGEARGRNPLLQTAPAALVMAHGPGLTPRSRRFSRDQPEMSITVTNTELLQKLFECVVKDTSAANAKQKNSSMVGQLRRMKSRKLPAQPEPAHQPMVGGAKQLLSSRHDPYLVDSIADKLFPQLSLEAGGRGARPAGGAYGGHSTLQLVSVREGDNVLTLPALTNDQNYGAMLNELVAHI